VDESGVQLGPDQMLMRALMAIMEQRGR
jgi:hypothetical protein